MEKLTAYEVERISGGVGPVGSAFGALTGAAGYLGQASTSGNFSWGGLATATGTGAATGFVGGAPASAAARYLIPRITAAGGAVGGAQ